MSEHPLKQYVGFLRCAVFAFTLLMCLSAYPSESYPQKLVVIVNPSNTVTKMTRHELKDIFLKKNRRWPDGTLARPVDRNEGSQERKLFLDQYLEKSPVEITQYWIGQKLYTGDSAPFMVDSNEHVLKYISAFPGSVGYVSAGTIYARQHEYKFKVIPITNGNPH